MAGAPNSKFVFTFHYLAKETDDRVVVRHNMVTQEFPNADLLRCVAYFEEESVKILKKGSTGNGRM